MDFFEVVNRRYSYRGEFEDVPIPREQLIKIVEAGLAAPSGKNCQTTNFIIIDDKNLLKEIGQMHSMPAMRTAKAIIACIVDKNPLPVYEGFSFVIEDCSAAVENMLLAITALGYASVWIQGWLYLEGRREKINRLLKLPEEKTTLIILPLGKPKEEGVRKAKLPFSKRAYFNFWLNGEI